MNERIQEMARQAGAQHRLNLGVEEFCFEHGELAKFAELIVKECLILVNERQQRAPSDDDGYFKTALDMVSTDIEQHFGVEE